MLPLKGKDRRRIAHRLRKVERVFAEAWKDMSLTPGQVQKLESEAYWLERKLLRKTRRGLIESSNAAAALADATGAGESWPPSPRPDVHRRSVGVRTRVRVLRRRVVG